MAILVFLALTGWHVGHTPVRACVGVPASRCIEARTWASTVPFRDCAACLPHRTLATLPPDGIVLQLGTSREASRYAPPRQRWPYAIRRRDVYTGGEGIPPRFAAVQRYFRVGRLDVMLWAFFGRAHPTDAQLGRANRMLRRATWRP
jgi:hypothetical protein